MDSDINMKANEFCLTHYLRALNDIVADDCRWLCIVIRLNRFISHRFVHSIWFHETAQQKIRNYHHFKRDAIHFICKEITFQANTQKELTRNKKKKRKMNGTNCSGCWLVGSPFNSFKAHCRWWAKLLNCSETDPSNDGYLHRILSLCLLFIQFAPVYFRWSDVTQ